MNGRLRTLISLLKGIITCFQRQTSLSSTMTLTFQTYICIHAQHFVQKRSLHLHLADAFIQSDLQCIQAIHFFVSMCVFPGNRTHNLCAANATL